MQNTHTVPDGGMTFTVSKIQIKILDRQALVENQSLDPAENYNPSVADCFRKCFLGGQICNLDLQS